MRELTSLIIGVKCEKCGYVPAPDVEQSNKNWKVYDTICPKCGGRMSLCLKGGDAQCRQVFSKTKMVT